MNKLPDFLIVGVQKAGTTSIADYLNQHPECGISSIKEPSFFSYFGLPEKEYIKLKQFNKYIPSFDVLTDLEEYIKLFPIKPIKGEASTHYFYHYKNTIKNIKNLYGKKYKELRIIISLRNPIDRAFSAWSMFVRDKKENRPFLQALKESKETYKKTGIADFDYVGFSLYSKALESFLCEFDNVKIIFFDDLKKNPLIVMKEIYRFLGVDYNFTPDTSIKLNVSGKPTILYEIIIRKNPLKPIFKKFIPLEKRKKIRAKLEAKLLKKMTLSSADRKLALEYFSNDIEKVEKLLNKDLSKWKMVE